MTKDELISEVTSSRAAISRDYAAVRIEMDFPSKLKGLVRKEPFAWLGGAAALGWILAGPKTKTRVVTKLAKPGAPPKQVKEKASRPVLVAALITGARFAFPLLKPVITAYAGRRLSELAERLAK